MACQSMSAYCLQVTCTVRTCPRSFQKQVRVAKHVQYALQLYRIFLCCPAAGFALVGAATAYQLWTTAPATTVCQQALCEEADDHEFENWSATHKVRPKQLFQPETTQELQQIVADCQTSGGAAHALMSFWTCYSHLHVTRSKVLSIVMVLLRPAILLALYCTGQRIRVVGSGLSPNGMAFCPQGMLSTALLDKVISVDNDKQQVTVQAGARVQQVNHVHDVSFMHG